MPAQAGVEKFCSMLAMAIHMKNRARARIIFRSARQGGQRRLEQEGTMFCRNLLSSSPGFRLPTSDFRLLISGFRLLISDFRLLTPEKLKPAFEVLSFAS